MFFTGIISLFVFYSFSQPVKQFSNSLNSNCYEFNRNGQSAAVKMDSTGQKNLQTKNFSNCTEMQNMVTIAQKPNITLPYFAFHEGD